MSNSMRLTVPYDEFRVWKQLIKLQFSGLNDAAEEILEYAITETLNNAQDHSEAKKVAITCNQTQFDVSITITDDGVGIFKRIMDYLGLDQPLDAAIELTKGKFTTQPSHHSGEGLYFTAQAVDRLVICANAHQLALAGASATFVEDKQTQGTQVAVYVKKQINRSLEDIFDAHCHKGKDQIPVFNRTVFRLQLAQSEGRLVSRSQAKRVMRGMERFATVEVDCTGVVSMGQGFADEMFRVWPSFHPKISVNPISTSAKIRQLITRVKRVE